MNDPRYEKMTVAELESLIALVRSTECGSASPGSSIDALWRSLGGKPYLPELIDYLIVARRREKETSHSDT
jgi:hypothetical protein